MIKEYIVKKSIGNQSGRVFSQKEVGELVRCKDCKHWDRDTLKHQLNDFREWDEAECECLSERDGYNEIDHYVESDDYCSYGERQEEINFESND